MSEHWTRLRWTAGEYALLCAELRAQADEPYRLFHARLLPGVSNLLGVRTPKLRRIAREIAAGELTSFLALSTDDTYEETMLRGLAIGYAALPRTEAFLQIEAFLPSITNWAICDMCTSSFRCLARADEETFEFVRAHLASSEEYTVRFAVVALLDYFVTEQWIDQVLALLCAVQSEAYYVRMATAWALSICFVKFCEPTLAALKTQPLDDFTYNKTLQKCCESTRVSDGQRALLRSMKRKISSKGVLL
ncbi:MAG: DNA alkylation repair protein [Pygmaiobacter sp.]